jgi:hypothetical protein
MHLAAASVDPDRDGFIYLSHQVAVSPHCLSRTEAERDPQLPIYFGKIYLDQWQSYSRSIRLPQLQAQQKHILEG